jgi:predicted GNAT family N-acyltransferase
MKIHFIKHSDLENYYLLKIINLKNQHWHYSTQQHENWIKDNIDKDDYHLLLTDGKDNLLAYLNMSNLLVLQNPETQISGLGIGNVCVDKGFNNKGLGLLLMQIANYHIKNLEKQGFLLCKTSLVSFYKKANWQLFDGEFLINQENIEAKLMYLLPISEKLISLNKKF